MAPEKFTKPSADEKVIVNVNVPESLAREFRILSKATGRTSRSLFREAFSLLQEKEALKNDPTDKKDR